MSKQIKEFPKGTEERKRLELAASLMTFLSPKRKQYEVKECYFDVDQKWVWSTILGDIDDEWGGYQALDPAQQLAIIGAETVEDMQEIVHEIFANCMVDRKDE